MPIPRVRFVSYFVLMERMMKDMTKAALHAAATEAVNSAKRNARGGFKGGAFVTNGWRSITFQLDLSRDLAIVGSNLKHFMYWEMGHPNIFTRRYERNRWLTKAVFGSGELKKRELAATAAVEQVAVKYAALTPGFRTATRLAAVFGS